MKRYRSIILLAALPLIVGGCGWLPGIIGGPNRTTVRLINNTPFPVEVDLFYYDIQEAPEAIITSLGTEVNETVASGGVFSFSRDCDEIQAVIIDDADLRIIGGVGPEERTDVLRDGDDFGCGDIITFTFTSSALGTDFQIATSVD